MDIASLGHALSVWLLPIILAITLHEAAHGWAADRLGDDTARRAGRVSLNPIRHVDPVGTLLLPGFLLMVAPIVFGWAKPVPVQPGRLHHPKRDMALVAAAGPALNFVLAVVCAWLLLLPATIGGDFGLWLQHNLLNALLINLVLGVFNLFPVPPLDGGRIAVGLLPMGLARRWAQLERYGLLILLGLLFVVPLVTRQLGTEISPLATFVFGVLRPVVTVVAALSPWSADQLWGAIL
ncbi:MAG: site-2 protease family protein [Alphaproteobacteria bacterium]